MEPLSAASVDFTFLEDQDEAESESIAKKWRYIDGSATENSFGVLDADKCFMKRYVKRPVPVILSRLRERFGSRNFWNKAERKRLVMGRPKWTELCVLGRKR